MPCVLAKMAAGQVQPVINRIIPLGDLDKGLQRLESRQLFGKIIVTLRP